MVNLDVNYEIKSLFNRIIYCTIIQKKNKRVLLNVVYDNVRHLVLF